MAAFDDFMESLREQGRVQGERWLFARVVRRRFAEVPAAVLARIDAADSPQLYRWVEQLFAADSVDDLFGG